MRTAPIVIALLALFQPSPSFSDKIGGVRIVLHAEPTLASNTCSTPADSGGLDCELTRPLVTISPGADVDVYVYIQNYDSLAGAQMAFHWAKTPKSCFTSTGTLSTKTSVLTLPS